MMFSKPRKERDEDRRKERLKIMRTISSNKLKPFENLGSGGFGQVCRVQYKNKNFAFKCSIGAIDENKRLVFLDEAAKQWNLRHVNIVHLYGIVNEPDNVGLVMEYLANGDMEKYIINSQVPVPAKHVCLLIQDVSEGMKYLHAQPIPIIHGDLKIENVLISDEGHAKITDFGLSFWKDYSKKHSDNKDVVSGTLRSIPPEYFSGKSLRKEEKFDVYGFGIFMWESIMKQTAFKGGNVMITGWVQNGKRPSLDKFPEDYPLLLKSLIKSCWEMEPDSRPLFPIICQQLAGIPYRNVPGKSLDDVDMVDGSGLNSNADSATIQDVEMVSARLLNDIKGNSHPVVRGDETDVQRIEKALQKMSCRTEKSELKFNINEGQFHNSKYWSATHKVWGPITYKPTIFPRNVDYGKNLTYFWHEINIHMKLSHPNILKFIGIHYDHRDCGLIFEQIPLHVQELSSPVKLQILKDVSFALTYLHSLETPIIHCCVKHKSVYLFDNHRGKLSDFQFAQEKTEDAKLDISRFVVDGKPATYHIPVEYFKNPKLPLSEAIDTYGFACMIVEVLNTVDGMKPLQTSHPGKNIIEMISCGLPEHCRFPNDVSRGLTEVVNSCFDKEQDKWPSIEDIRKQL